MLQSSGAAFVKDNLGADQNKFLWNNTRNNGYVGYQNAFAGIGQDGLADVDTDGKKEAADRDLTIGGINRIYSGITTSTTARMRAFSEHGAALDIKQKIGITMRSEEVSKPIPVLSPGLNTKVKEYETTVSQGGFFAGLNYLLAWRPSTMNYQYVDSYSQNSDAAGFDGYLSEYRNVSNDAGDGSMLHSGNGDTKYIKWQGGGFGEGYLATKNDKMNGNADTDDNKGDIGQDTDNTNDDYRFANTYYVHSRRVKIDSAQYDLATFANNGVGANDGILTQEADANYNNYGMLNNHDDGLDLFDVVNGNNFEQNVSDKNGDGDFDDSQFDPIMLQTVYERERMPGGGKIDETFNGNWIGRQIKINNFNGNAMTGNANNPIFGNIELARYQVYQDPDETLNNASYLNGYNIDMAEANDKRRMGQVRLFSTSTGNQVYRTDQRPQDQNSMAELILEIMRKPQYKDVFRLGLFKDIAIQGGANAPAGGVITGTVRLSYIMSPDKLAAREVPGKGIRPGIRGEMILFQDKYQAKGS